MCLAKRPRVPTSVAEVATLAPELLQSDIGVDTVPSLDIPVTSDGNVTTLATELDEVMEDITELESMETLTGRGREDVLEKIKQRHAKEDGAWKETSAGKTNSLINDVTVAKAEGIKISVERNEIPSRFAEHVSALHALVKANVEHKVPLNDAMKTLKELLESCRSIKKSEYSVKTARLNG